MAEARLAYTLSSRGHFAEASQALAAALAHSDAFVTRTEVDVDVDQLRVLWFSAELDALGHTPPSFDARKRLGDAYSRIVASRDTAFRLYERWFDIYLAMKRARIPARSTLKTAQHHAPLP